jgi:hypothetical protein
MALDLTRLNHLSYNDKLEFFRRVEQKKQRQNRQTDWTQYVDDPVGFVHQGLGEFLWSKQREVFKAIQQYDRVAVKSCHSSGKSFSVARLAGWWIASHKPGEAFVVSTAPTFAQVRAILWREINRVHKKGKLPGYTNQTEWFINNELVAFGRKPDDDSTVAFQGVHARFILVILDEAGGVPGSIWNAAETLAANGGKIIAIGNPDDPLTEFKRVCDPGLGWKVITISAFDTPNFTGEEVPQYVRELLVSKDWVDRYRHRWTEQHPFFLSKVLGEFPDVSTDSLIPMSLVRAAVERHIDPTEPNELGVDVARKGGNESIIYHRRGSVARLYGAYTQRTLMELVGYIVRAIVETGATRVKIDDPGMGGGVTDRLIELQNETYGPLPNNLDIIPVNVGLPPSDNDSVTKKFANLKAELSWQMRERFERGDIDLGPDEDTMAQIAAIKYGVTSRGWLKVASKEEMQKEMAELETDAMSLSPDRWDALVLAFAETIPGDVLGEWRVIANMV